jgi:hypothetical protein
VEFAGEQQELIPQALRIKIRCLRTRVRPDVVIANI